MLRPRLSPKASNASSAAEKWDLKGASPLSKILALLELALGGDLQVERTDANGVVLIN